MAVAVLSPFDFNKTELLNAKIQNLGVDPSGLGAGDKGLLWISAAGAIKYWDGTTVKTVGEASGGNASTLNGQAASFYLDRANHSGSQLAASISDFTAAARGSISKTDTTTLALTYSAGVISGAVLDSPTVAGATPAQLRDRSTHSGTQLANTISNFDTQVRASRLDQMALPTAAVNFNSQKATNLADGTAITDAATYGQLLAVIEGKTWKDPVRAATTANITLSGTQTIDGVAVVAGDRVLVKNQTAGAANGIYVVAAGAWSRSTDFDSATEANRATVIATEGTVNQGDVFTQTANVATLGTTVQTWVKTGEGNQTYSADGTTVTLSGSTFSVGTIGAANIGVGAIDVTTTRVTGTLPGAKGGTGHATNTVGDILFGSAGSDWSRLPAVAAGNVLRSAGAATAPAWGKVALTTDVSGTLPIGNGGTGQTTAAAALTALGGTRKVTTDIGNGSLTAIVVNHAMNTRDVQVEVYRNSTPWDSVMVDIERTDVNNVTIRFATAPAANAFRVVVVG